MPTDTRLPYRVFLVHQGKRHVFNLEPIYANDPEEAWRMVLGKSLGLSLEESLIMNGEKLTQRFNEQAARDGEPGVEGVFVERWEISGKWLPNIG